jgi:hypothetical protein
MFHPLITPLTTYTYTTDIQDNGTVSATDEERLPPGGFSLRHGFPEWFGRGRRSAAGSRQVSGGQPGPGGFSTPKAKSVGEPLLLSSAQQSPESVYSASAGRGGGRGASAYDVLKYIRSAFTDENILDSLTLGEAGNPGAWHAWRTHRRKLIRLKETDGDGDGEGDAVASDSGKALASQSGARKPGEWNWDGVWEDRVKKSIAASLSEPVLYGASSHPDELVRRPLPSGALLFSVIETNDLAIDSFPGNGGKRSGLGQGKHSSYFREHGLNPTWTGYDFDSLPFCLEIRLLWQAVSLDGQSRRPSFVSTSSKRALISMSTYSLLSSLPAFSARSTFQFQSMHRTQKKAS